MMENAIFDTNIILDCLLNREEFVDDAIALIKMVNDKKINGYLIAKQIADIYYLVKGKLHSKPLALESIISLSNLFTIIDSTALSTLSALKSKMNDFEDAMIVETCKQYAIDTIVTRNIKDFKDSGLKVYTPKQYLKLVKNI